jgi:hypothetical protein
MRLILPVTELSLKRLATITSSVLSLYTSRGLSINALILLTINVIKEFYV